MTQNQVNQLESQVGGSAKDISYILNCNPNVPKHGLDYDVDIIPKTFDSLEIGEQISETSYREIKAEKTFRIPIPLSIDECKTSLDFKLFDTFKELRNVLQTISVRNRKHFEIDQLTYKLIDR